MSYSENNPNHRPSPFDQYGTVSTTDTAGLANNAVSEVSPVFDQGRASALQTAAKALDPTDATPRELVVLPEAVVTVLGPDRKPEEGKADLERALAEIEVEEPAEAPAEEPAEEPAEPVEEKAEETPAKPAAKTSTRK